MGLHRIRSGFASGGVPPSLSSKRKSNDESRLSLDRHSRPRTLRLGHREEVPGTVCAKPLSLIKNPYIILAAVFIVGHCLGLVITSAAGLAMLMVVTVYPLIIRVGCSPLAAAAVVASVLAIGYAPASGTANIASQLVHLDPIEYLVRYQLPMAVPTILAMALAHRADA